MSQKVASKRSLDNLKEDNSDVAATDQIAKKNKIGGSKSGSNDNDVNDNGGNDKNENKENKENKMEPDEEEEDKDVAFDVQIILQGEQVTSEKSVTGLKELKALKNENEEYINESALYHVVPQFPQTREKDNEMRLHLIDRANCIEFARYYLKAEDRMYLLPFMLDKNGGMVASNIDWDKAEPVMDYAKGEAELRVAMLLKCIDNYYSDDEDEQNNSADKPFDGNEVGADGFFVRHQNAGSMEGFEFQTFEEFTVAFEKLLTESKSFLENNSNEPVKIYVEVIGDKKTNIYLINYMPN